MLFDDKTKGIAQAYLSMLEENNKLNESHFKVGDKVKCIASGMMGIVTKLGKPEEGKYYTVKQDSGKMMKYSPDELKKVSDVKEEKIPKGYHKMPDGTIMKDGDHKKEVKEKLDSVNSKAVKKKFDDRIDTDIDNDGDVDSSDEYLHKRRKAIAKATKSEAIEIEMSKKSKLNNNNNDDDDDDDEMVANGNDKMKVKAKKGSDDEKGMKEASCGKVKEAMEKKSSLPFKPTSTKKPAKNSDGTPQSPMSRARALAQQGMRKQMTKEDVEQVDELSKSTMGSYVKKASGSQFKAGHDAGEKKDTSATQSAINKASKRQQGIGRAVSKLTREKTDMEESSAVKAMARDAERRAGSVMKPKSTKPKPRPGSMEAMRAAAEKRRMREDLEWDWDAILESSEDFIYGMIDEMSYDDLESFVSELEQINEISIGALARAARTASDPGSDGRHDPQKFADYAKRKKGAKAGRNVQGAADGKSHYSRPGSSSDLDKMKLRQNRSTNPNMVTKSGKLTKGAQKGLKSQMKEDLEWDWDAIFDAPEEEIDAMIEEMNDADYESFVSEFELVEEGANMYQSSTRSKQPMTPDGKETLEPRAEADKAFTAAHRQTTDIKDYPGKDKPVTNAKSQASLRPGDKRSSEPMKTLSDIRRK